MAAATTMRHRPPAALTPLMFPLQATAQVTVVKLPGYQLRITMDLVKKAAYVIFVVFVSCEIRRGYLSYKDTLEQNLGFYCATFICICLHLLFILVSIDFRLDRHITPRLRVVTAVYVHEMNNVLAIMKLWERQWYKEDIDPTTLLTTATRLNKFLTAIDSTDLSRKIHDLQTSVEELSATQLSLGPSFGRTFRRLWSLIFGYSWTDPTDREVRKLHSTLSNLSAIEARLVSRLLLPDALFSQWTGSQKTQNLIEEIEETTRDFQSLAKRLSKMVDLPDFDKAAVLSCWTLGVTRDADGTQSKRSHQILRLEPEVALHSDEVELVGFGMERAELIDVDKCGKYRGICKLAIALRVKDKSNYGNGIGTEWCNGTGWLVDSWTVVTAAHNLYGKLDEAYAYEVKVSIGLTKNSRNIETQWGQFAAIHWGFYAAGRRQNDMAVVRLRSPFLTAVPVSYCGPHLVENNPSHLRLVGYPGSRGGGGEWKGNIMHVSEGAHKEGWNLESTDFIIRHRLDSDTGHSGCPLLKDNEDGGFDAIAIHAGAGGTVDRRWNEAVPLGYKGNDVKAFCDALRILEHGADAGAALGTLVEDLRENIPGSKKITIPL